MSSRQIWLLAGGNGAGKSTFYREMLQPLGLPCINADVLAKSIYPDAPEKHSYEAAKLAEELRYRLVQDGRSFCFETVFSHPSKVDFAGHAMALGYEIILVFIHLEVAELNMARVAQRVAEGGYSVPDEKVESRIPRALQNARAVLPLCDRAYLLDNSSADHPFLTVAEIIGGEVRMRVDPVPPWVQEIVG